MSCDCTKCSTDAAKDGPDLSVGGKMMPALGSIVNNHETESGDLAKVIYLKSSSDICEANFTDSKESRGDVKVAPLTGIRRHVGKHCRSVQKTDGYDYQLISRGSSPS